MRRRKWILLLFAAAAVAVALWLAGRAPTRFVLEEECRRYQAERVRRFQELQLQIARVQAARAGDPAEVGDRLAQLIAEVDRLRRGHRALRIRGWAVLLIPAGAARPDPGEFLRAGRFDPSTDADPPPLRGVYEIWVEPTGWLARLLHRLRLAP